MKSELKRWRYIASGLVMMLCLGTVYSWSVFRSTIESHYQVGSALSGMPYMVALMSYAIAMMLTGRVLDRVRPTWVIWFGSLWVSLGWILSAWAPNIWALTATYGLMSGSGVGIIYGVPMATVAKWYPERKGFAVGLVLMGFGVSPLLTAPIARGMVTALGLQPTFLWLGLAFGLVLALCGSVLKNPTDSVNGAETLNSPKSLESSEPLESTAEPSLDKAALMRLYVNFLLGTLIGLTLIGKTSTMGAYVTGEPQEALALWLSLFAVFNGLGRPLFGWLVDCYSPRVAMLLAYWSVVAGSVLILAEGLPAMLRFVLAFSLYWMSLGAWLAIAPATTQRLVGARHYSRVYGAIFTAYGLGAVLGTLAAGVLLDWLGDFRLVIYGILFVALVGIGLVTLQKRQVTIG